MQQQCTKSQKNQTYTLPSAISVSRSKPARKLFAKAKQSKAKQSKAKEV